MTTRKTLSLSVKGKPYGSMWQAPDQSQTQIIEQELLSSVQKILHDYETTPANNYVEEFRKSSLAVKNLLDSLKNCQENLVNAMRYPKPREQMFEQIIGNVRAQLNELGARKFDEAFNGLGNNKAHLPKVVEGSAERSHSVRPVHEQRSSSLRSR